MTNPQPTPSSNSGESRDVADKMTKWDFAILIIGVAVIYISGFASGDQRRRADIRELKRQIFISAMVCGASPESSTDFACQQLAELSK